jgi:hypothetical protein
MAALLLPEYIAFYLLLAFMLILNDLLFLAAHSSLGGPRHAVVTRLRLLGCAFGYRWFSLCNTVVPRYVTAGHSFG